MAKSLLPSVPKLRSPGKGTPRAASKPPPVGKVGLDAVDFRLPTVFPRGPRGIGVTRRRHIVGGPGLPPPGFIIATTSGIEWDWYWASFVVLPTDKDARTPPFTGIPGLMDYQVADDPLNVRAIGSAVDDFVYHLGTGDVHVRIDTFRYHLETTPQQLARDAYLKLHGQNADVVTVSAWDVDIIGDPTGRAACAAVARALSGRERISPVKSGHAFPPRDLITEHSS